MKIYEKMNKTEDEVFENTSPKSSLQIIDNTPCFEKITTKKSLYIDTLQNHNTLKSYKELFRNKKMLNSYEIILEE